MGPNGAVCPGPVLRPSRCSQPRGNGSHLRPNPRRETIQEPIGIYSSRSTRSDIERGGAGALRSRLISRPRRYYLARSRAISRVNRSQPIIRSKRSVYEDVCSTLNRLKTPRWADTTRVGSAPHPTPARNTALPRMARPAAHAQERDAQIGLRCKGAHEGVWISDQPRPVAQPLSLSRAGAWARGLACACREQR